MGLGEHGSLGRPVPGDVESRTGPQRAVDGGDHGVGGGVGDAVHGEPGGEVQIRRAHPERGPAGELDGRRTALRRGSAGDP